MSGPNRRLALGAMAGAIWGASTLRGMSPGGISVHELPHLAQRTVRPLGRRELGSTE